jgi:hypothetical protein
VCVNERDIPQMGHANVRAFVDNAPMANEKLIRPEALASELGVSGKLIRSYLRANFARKAEAKNTAWVLTANQAAAVRKHFKARRSNVAA